MYYPGATLFHRLNPLTKLVLAASLSLAVFLNPHLSVTLPLLALSIALLFVANASKAVLKSVFRFIAFFLVVLFVVQSLWWQGESATWQLGPLTIRQAGFYYSLLIASRLLVVLLSFYVLMYSTHPSDLVQSLEQRGLSPRISYVILATLQAVTEMQERADRDHGGPAKPRGGDQRQPAGARQSLRAAGGAADRRLAAEYREPGPGPGGARLLLQSGQDADENYPRDALGTLGAPAADPAAVCRAGMEAAVSLAVEIRDLRYTYPGSEQPALAVEHLAVRPGEFVCLVGANAAGKSTLCRAVAGLIPHFYNGQLEGSVQVYGQETAGSTISDLAGRVGYVMDDPFDQLTRATYTVYAEIAFGLQNIGMPVDEIHRSVAQVLEELGIAALAQRVPTTLSGGEQQRVAIASIFARRPDILVMDEATSQLDPQGTEAIFQLVRHFQSLGKTILMVEPKLDKILQHADRLVFLHEGRILADGPVREVLNAGVFEQTGLGLPSYPALARGLQSAGLYAGPLPVHLEEAKAVVVEALHDRD